MAGLALHTGWLLDLYEDPLGGIVLWFLDDDGARRCLRQPFPVIFYAAGRAERLRALQDFLAQQPEPNRSAGAWRMDVFARREIPVLAVEVARPALLPGLFRRACRQFADLEFADADLPLSLRYAAATGVSPLCRCQVTFDSADTLRAIAALESPWDLDPSTIPLRTLTLEPDENPAHRTPRALLVQSRGETYRLALEPARALLVGLQSFLKSRDPDLLLTSWGDTWLLPLLLELAEKGAYRLALNRDSSASIVRRKERWYFSYGQIIYRGEQVHLFGRWHIDRNNAMMWSDYELDGVLEMARVTCLPLQTAARVSPGTGISAIQMLTALRHGILVPWQKQQAEMLKPAADLFAADQGGLVFQPRMGVHRQVAAIDFISMFPSEMVFFNLSPETIGVPGPDSVQVPGLNLLVDRGRKGIVPMALEPLLRKRVDLKRRQSTLAAWDPRRKLDKRRSSALKWLLVTCFGYLGYKNARFGRIEAHQAVTAYARDALLQAKEAAEDAGLELVHAYIDGLWLKNRDIGSPGDTSPGDPLRGEMLLRCLDGLLAEIERRTGLPIALDGIYRWVVFLPSRVRANRPVANRYFGVFQDGELKVRGIAARRRDTPGWIADVQMEILQRLAGAEEPAQAVPGVAQWLRGELRHLRAGLVAPERLLITQRMSREVEDYRSRPPAARAARQLREAGKTIKPGQSIRFLLTLGEPGVFAWDLPARPDPETINFARYAELMLRAAEEVLAPFLGEQMLGNLLEHSAQAPLPELEGEAHLLKGNILT